MYNDEPTVRKGGYNDNKFNTPGPSNQMKGKSSANVYTPLIGGGAKMASNNNYMNDAYGMGAQKPSAYSHQKAGAPASGNKRFTLG